jgi:hypothetical protein
MEKMTDWRSIEDYPAGETEGRRLAETTPADMISALAGRKRGATPETKR